MERQEIFSDVLSKIQRKDIKQFLREAIDLFPDYFFEIPASITEKHHPLWALGPGGLVRHTLAVIKYVEELAPTFELSPNSFFNCLVAATLHDSLKYGFEFDKKHYKAYQLAHPVLVGPYFENLRSRLLLDSYTYQSITHLVERHMGNYASGKWSPTDSKLETKADALLHLADYVVSRDTFIFEPFKEFHCEAEKQPDVPWLEAKNAWWREIVENNKYYKK